MKSRRCRGLTGNSDSAAVWRTPFSKALALETVCTRSHFLRQGLSKALKSLKILPSKGLPLPIATPDCYTGGMEEVARHPHLILRGTTWHYRRKVPADLLGYYAPSREVTFSLKTKTYSEAVQKARKEGVRLDEEFSRIRALANAGVRSVISSDEIARVVQTYLHESLAADEALRFQGGQDEELYERQRERVLAAGGKAAYAPDGHHPWPASDHGG